MPLSDTVIRIALTRTHYNPWNGPYQPGVRHTASINRIVWHHLPIFDQQIQWCKNHRMATRIERELVGYETQVLGPKGRRGMNLTSRPWQATRPA
jgi:hypothetical protein